MHLIIKSMLVGFVKIFEMCRSNQVRFSPSQRAELEELRVMALGGFMHLAELTHARSLPLFKPIPKLHLLDELLRQSIKGGLSPQTSACLQAEDFAGKIMRMAVKTHPRSMHVRVVQRWLVYYVTEFMQL